jgi:hypothetical protein
MAKSRDVGEEGKKMGKWETAAPERVGPNISGKKRQDHIVSYP